MQIAYLEKKDPDQNMHRFYAISVSPTLFGSWALVRQWGRIGSRGSRMEKWFGSEEEAREVGANIKGKKMKRGYAP